MSVASDALFLWCGENAFCDMDDVAIAAVGPHGPSLSLVPAVDRVDISHADPLQLANDAS